MNNFYYEDLVEEKHDLENEEIRFRLLLIQIANTD